MQLYPSIIDRLANQYQSIQPILASIDESRFWVKPPPNKWNIHDNMAHLVSYQPIFLGRVNEILVNENPTLVVTPLTTTLYLLFAKILTWGN